MSSLCAGSAIREAHADGCIRKGKMHGCSRSTHTVFGESSSTHAAVDFTVPLLRLCMHDVMFHVHRIFLGDVQE